MLQISLESVFVYSGTKWLKTRQKRAKRSMDGKAELNGALPDQFDTLLKKIEEKDKKSTSKSIPRM